MTLQANLLELLSGSKLINFLKNLILLHNVRNIFKLDINRNERDY